MTLSSQLARMILSHVKISLPLRAVLIKHTKPVDKSVRTTFIHFLMAFLFDGSVSVIWPLLDIKGKYTVTHVLYENVFLHFGVIKSVCVTWSEFLEINCTNMSLRNTSFRILNLASSYQC